LYQYGESFLYTTFDVSHPANIFVDLLPNWRLDSVAVVSSSSSSEVMVLAGNKQDIVPLEIDENRRAVLPAFNEQETIPLGSALDFTSTTELPPLNRDADPSPVPPAPIYIILNNVGQITGWHFLDVIAVNEKSPFKGLLQPSPFPMKDSTPVVPSSPEGRRFTNAVSGDPIRATHSPIKSPTVVTPMPIPVAPKPQFEVASQNKQSDLKIDPPLPVQSLKLDANPFQKVAASGAPAHNLPKEPNRSPTIAKHVTPARFTFMNTLNQSKKGSSPTAEEDSGSSESEIDEEDDDDEEELSEEELSEDEPLKSPPMHPNIGSSTAEKIIRVGSGPVGKSFAVFVDGIGKALHALSARSNEIDAAIKTHEKSMIQTEPLLQDISDMEVKLDRWLLKLEKLEGNALAVCQTTDRWKGKIEQIKDISNRYLEHGTALPNELGPQQAECQIKLARNINKVQTLMDSIEEFSQQRKKPHFASLIDIYQCIRNMQAAIVSRQILVDDLSRLMQKVSTDEHSSLNMFSSVNVLADDPMGKEFELEQPALPEMAIVLEGSGLSYSAIRAKIKPIGDVPVRKCNRNEWLGMEKDVELSKRTPLKSSAFASPTFKAKSPETNQPTGLFVKSTSTHKEMKTKMGHASANSPKVPAFQFGINPSQIQSMQNSVGNISIDAERKTRSKSSRSKSPIASTFPPSPTPNFKMSKPRVVDTFKLESQSIGENVQIRVPVSESRVPSPVNADPGKLVKIEKVATSNLLQNPKPTSNNEKQFISRPAEPVKELLLSSEPSNSAQIVAKGSTAVSLQSHKEKDPLPVKTVSEVQRDQPRTPAKEPLPKPTAPIKLVGASSPPAKPATVVSPKEPSTVMPGKSKSLAVVDGARDGCLTKSELATNGIPKIEEKKDPSLISQKISDAQNSEEKPKIKPLVIDEVVTSQSSATTVPSAIDMQEVTPTVQSGVPMEDEAMEEETTDQSESLNSLGLGTKPSNSNGINPMFASSTPFGNPQSSSSTGFGQPKENNAPATGFGFTPSGLFSAGNGVKPAFGQSAGGFSNFSNSTPAPTAFGQPVAFGQTSSFGASMTGAPQTPFASNSLGATPKFGERSSFGAPVTGFGSNVATPAFGGANKTVFGSPSALGGGVTFGQPSSFGAPVQPNSSPFGGSMPSAPTSAFGTSSAPFTGVKSGGFAAFASPTSTPSPFGATSASSNVPPKPPAFANNSSAFTQFR
jgi:hypothetical protein